MSAFNEWSDSLTETMRASVPSDDWTDVYVAACEVYADGVTDVLSCLKIARYRVRLDGIDAGRVEARMADVESFDVIAETVPSLWSQSIPSPERIHAVATASDVLGMVEAHLWHVADDADVRVFLDAAAAFVDHLRGAHGCPVCQGVQTAKRPTLASVLAHEAGQTASGAIGKATARALARLTEYLTPALRDSLADLMQSTPHGIGTVTAHPAMPASDGPSYRVSLPSGVVRDVSEVERSFIDAPNQRHAARTAHPLAGDHAGGTGSVGNGDARSHKVPVSPRKKAGSGATGPTIALSAMR